jgi:hypothetical protein
VGTVGGIAVAEWSAFLGRHADRYVRKFARFSIGGVDSYALTINWPAAFVPFWWALYRKLYVWAAVFLVMPFVPYGNIVLWLLTPFVANYILYTEAKKRILAVKAANPSRDVSGLLAQVGGVHGWVPVVAVLCSGGLVLLVFGLGLAAVLFDLLDAFGMPHRVLQSVWSLVS